MSNDEFEIVKQHTTFGHELLKLGDSPVLNLAANIALHHHEKIDGTGYPNKLKGNQIPIEARISAVAYAFDSMTSKRNHRPSLSTEEAIEIIKNEIDKSFDKDCVIALINNIDALSPPQIGN